MKVKAKFVSYIVLILCSFGYGQINDYNHKRELQGITAQWHKVVLPEDIFAKISSNNLFDIRIFGITAANDTIETSYMLQIKSEKIAANEIDFKIINTSHNKNGYYFTLEVPTEESINQLKLDFEQQNFDWQIKLEGSQNQQEWFTVVDNYRILSIKNSATDYQFTNVIFPTSRFHYFRLLINSKEKPELSATKVTFHEINNGNLTTYATTNVKTALNKQQKLTELELDLKSAVPVNSIKIGIKESFDYYRPVTIQYLIDSIKTEQGWKYNFGKLTSGTLSSIDNSEFKFQSTELQRLKISIHNLDNEPLTIESITVKGYVHELVARFVEPATYFLTYGNKKAAKPNYDISRFSSKVPVTLTSLTLGDEQAIEKTALMVTEPLFKNKIWLWAIMAIVILILGWFSINLIKSK